MYARKSSRFEEDPEKDYLNMCWPNKSGHKITFTKSGKRRHKFEAL